MLMFQGKRILLTVLLQLAAMAIFAQTSASSDTLHWRYNRPLTWDDFKGDPVPDIGINGEALCMNSANFAKANVFQKPKFTVVAIFDRKNSWINSDFKSDVGLTYFQVMFNIYEVHARALRKDLAETKFGADPTILFHEKYSTSLQNLSTEFNQFRRDTKLGRDEKALVEWKLKVDNELLQLDRFKL